MSYLEDYGKKQTESLERRLDRLYMSSYAKLKAKSEEYFDKWEERYEKEYKAMLAGKYTEAEFELWALNQLGRGKRWDQLCADMAKSITNTNVIAASYINGTTPKVFSTGYNFSAYEIEQNSGMAFNIYSESAVRRLLVEEPDLFPQAGINVPKDELWNRKKLTDSLIGSIMQGRPYDELANSFQAVANMNRTSAFRNARTAITGAMNAGRQRNMSDAKEQADKMGLKLKKMWCAAHDSRTRDSHAYMDGVTVNTVDKFPNGLMYPGDIKGRPAEVYNCRCYMKIVIDGITGSVGREQKTAESYEEWLESQKIKNYKAVNRGEQKEYVVKGQTLKTRKINGYDNIYITEDAVIKRRALHKIDKDIHDAASMYLPDGVLPVVVITTKEEIGCYGQYNVVTGVLSIADFGNENKHTVYHEMWHWKQAEEYRKKYGDIAEETLSEYNSYVSYQSKKAIDKLGITEYNVSEISDYAKKMYNVGVYDEVEAEYVTNRIKKR